MEGDYCICHSHVAYLGHTVFVFREIVMTAIIFDMTCNFCLRITELIKTCVSTIGDVAVDVVNSDLAD